MTLRPAITAVTLLAAAIVASADSPADPKGLSAEVLKIFQSRCIECHGKNAKEPEKFAFIDDLRKLRTSDYVNLTNPPASKLYLRVQKGDMPRCTQADKDAGKKNADPLAEEQVDTILSWLRIGAPADRRPPKDLLADDHKPVPLPPPPGPAPRPEPARLSRPLVTPSEELTAALTDLQTVSREDQPDIRYVSLAAASNNIRVSDAQLENFRHGVRKLLNSLSTAPRVATFAEVGPEKVLVRVRLRELGWDAALWDKIAAHFPMAIDTGLSAALGDACHAAVPILRADWLAATAARPPLYHDILRLPKHQQELEKNLGVDSSADLNAGRAVRAGLIKSGISLANRLIERHETGARPGYYWASYDFRNSSGRGNLLEYPLGPETAHLAGGQRAFKQAGSEFIFSLPNGFHGYFTADALGNRLDGAVPTDIVSDRTGITERVEISNGLSCITCHDRGIKSVDGQDAIRALASTFSAEEQHLIDRLHPPHEKFDGIWKADSDRFAVALKSADAEPVPGRPESVGALAALFDRDVSIETAAAEVGLSPDELARRLDGEPQLFSLRATLQNNGAVLRDQFLDNFATLVERLNLGRVRRAPQTIAHALLPDGAATARPISVELKTDKSTYREGDDLVVFVQTAETCHLRLIYQNAAGEICTLFPNQFITDDRIEGGRLVKIMPAPNPKKRGDEVAIQIAGPNFGAEYLAAIVTDQPFTDDHALQAQLVATPFAKSVAHTIEGAITKDARVVSRPAREGASGGARLGFARISLTTIRK